MIYHCEKLCYVTDKNLKECPKCGSGMIEKDDSEKKNLLRSIVEIQIKTAEEAVANMK